MLSRLLYVVFHDYPIMHSVTGHLFFFFFFFFFCISPFSSHLPIILILIKIILCWYIISNGKRSYLSGDVKYLDWRKIKTKTLCVKIRVLLCINNSLIMYQDKSLSMYQNKGLIMYTGKSLIMYQDKSLIMYQDKSLIMYQNKGLIMYQDKSLIMYQNKEPYYVSR